MKKRFKIGEYAVGGIIDVNIVCDNIIVDVLNYSTEDVLTTEVFEISDYRLRNNLSEYLNGITTSYYADQIIDWVFTKN